MAESRRIGKYEIIAEIGRGGFAVVYRARDTELDRLVALKVLHPHWAADPDFAARFHREAQIAAKLHHPNVVTVYEADEAGGQLYIAMEYLAGRTLQGLLDAEGVLSLLRAPPVLEQIAAALDYAHGRGVVHRDVKPANVIVEGSGQDVRATLTDFGLVKTMEGSTVLTSQGTLLGSPEYMAPEQADPERADEVGPAADRYALGVVAYRVLTGRVPFPGNSPATLNAHEHKPVPPPRSLRPELPEEVEAALLRMLAKERDQRYPAAGAFAAALRQAATAHAPKQETTLGQPKAQAHTNSKPAQAVVSHDLIFWQQDGKEMVRVPAGEFLCSEGEEIELPEYWIDRTPVTNAEYARFVQMTGYSPPRHWKGNVPPEEIADHPVVYVSRHDAAAYADWADKRLPSYWEWDKAACGTDGRLYPWGNKGPTPDLCNFGRNEGGTTPVGRYSPQGDSPYSCVDMAGNVWEWIAADRGWLRGGSWSNESYCVCIDYDMRDKPDRQCDFMGFRCAWSDE